jgi:hypothetical protein
MDEETLSAQEPAALSLEESLMGATTSAERQMRLFEYKMSGEDPFGVVAREARAFGEVFHERGSRSQTEAAGQAMDAAASRLNMPLMSREKQQLEGQHESGWISRAGIFDYQRVLDSENKRTLISFQFQEKDMVRSVLNTPGTTAITQRLSFLRDDVDPSEDRTTASIIMPNMLGIQASEMRQGGQSQIIGVRHPYAMHIKMGASEGTQGTGLAYISTQNITAPLQRNSTLESMLMFKIGQDSTSPGQREESAVGRELRDFVNAVSARADQMQSKAPRGVYSELGRGTRDVRRNLFVNEEISQMMSQVFAAAALEQGSQVTLSMGDASLLFGRSSSGTAQNLQSQVFQLMENSKLQLVTDQRRLWEALDMNREYLSLYDRKEKGVLTSSELQRLDQLTTQGAEIHPDVLRYLSRGNITAGPMGFHHDKSFQVRGEDGSLRALGIGSANMTSMSLVPLIERDSRERERVLQGLGFSADEVSEALKLKTSDDISARRLQADLSAGMQEILNVLESPNSTESTLLLTNQLGQPGMIKGPDGSDMVDSGALLAHLDAQGSVRKHFDRVAGRTSGGGTIFQGFASEQRISPRTSQEVLMPLEERLRALGQETGGLVSVSGRYKGTQLMGLSVEISSGGPAGRVNLVLSATNEGQVVLADRDKLITGSVVVNRGTQDMVQLLGGKDILVPRGSSAELDAIDTAVAAVATIGRRVGYEYEREMPLRWMKGGQQQQALLGVVSRALQLASPRLQGDMQTTLKGLWQMGEAERLTTIENTKNLLVTGAYQSRMDLDGSKTSVRQQVFKDFFGVLSWSMERSEGMVTESSLNPALNVLWTAVQNNSQSGAFQDLVFDAFSQSVDTDPSIRQMLGEAQREAVKTITDAFMPLGQHGYSGMQGKYRLPVMQVNRRGMTGAGRSRSLQQGGFMEPGVFDNRTLLHDTYIRLMGSTARYQTSRMRLTQENSILRAQDDSLAKGAAAVFSKKILRGIEGVGALTQKEYAAELARFGLSWDSLDWQGKEGEGLAAWKESVTRDTDSMIIWGAYASGRSEQLSQRLKNLLGTRSMEDIDADAFHYITRLGVGGALASSQMPSTPDGIISGRVLSALPQEQFEAVRAEIEAVKLEHPGWNAAAVEAEVARSFRQRGMHQDSTLRGVIGGERPRRVALSMGGSLLGDFNIGNADYFQGRGTFGSIGVRFSAGSVASMTQALTDIDAVLQADTFFVPNQRVIHPDEAGGPTIKLSPGVYQRRDGNLQLVGTFNSEGRVTLTETFTQFKHMRVLESLTMKIPAFTHRYKENSTTWIPAGTQMRVSGQSSRYHASIDAWTVGEDSSTFRPGYGPSKGPVDLRDGGFFRRLQEGGHLSEGLTSVDAGLYGMFSPSTLKGYRSQTGREILSDPTLRAAALAQVSTEGRDSAAALALAFMGEGTEIRAAMQGYLDDRVRLASPENRARLMQVRRSVMLAQTKALKDQNVVRSMPGLATLGGTLKGNAQDVMQQFRRVLAGAVSGDEAALAAFQAGTRALVEAGTQGGVAFGDRTDSRTLVSQQDLGAASAMGALEMMYMGRQLLDGPRVVRGSQGRDVRDVERFRTDHRHRQQVMQLAQMAGLSLEKARMSNDDDDRVLSSQLRQLEAWYDSNFLLEGLVEHRPSSELVTISSQHEVDVEFQNLLAMGKALTSSTYAPWRANPDGDGITKATSELTSSQQVFALLGSMSQTGLVDLGAMAQGAGLRARLFMGPAQDANNELDLAMRVRQAAVFSVPGVSDRMVAQALETGDTAQAKNVERLFNVVAGERRFDDGISAEDQLRLRAVEGTLIPGSQLAYFGSMNFDSRDTASVLLDNNLDAYISGRLGGKGDRMTVMGGALQQAHALAIEYGHESLTREFLRHAENGLTEDIAAAGPTRKSQLRQVQELGRLMAEKPALAEEAFNSYGFLRPLDMGVDEDGEQKFARLELGGEQGKEQARLFAQQVFKGSSQRGLESIQRSRGNVEAQYIQGMQKLQERGGVVGKAAKESSQVMIPAFRFEDSPEDGGVRLSIDPAGEPARMLLMGSEMLKNSKLTYTEEQEHQALRHQFEAVSLFNRLMDDTVDINGNKIHLDRLGEHFSGMKDGTQRHHIIHPEQAADLQRLQELAYLTQTDALDLMNTAQSNRAAANKTPAAGVTGFPTSSFDLDAEEVYVGGAFNALPSLRGFGRDIRHMMKKLDVTDRAPALRAELNEMRRFVSGRMRELDPKLQRQRQQVEDRFSPEVLAGSSAEPEAMQAAKMLRMLNQPTKYSSLAEEIGLPSLRQGSIKELERQAQLEVYRGSQADPLSLFPPEQVDWARKALARSRAGEGVFDSAPRRLSETSNVFRGGIPLGMAVGVGSTYERLGARALADRADEGKLRLPSRRVKGTMILPAIGRWPAGGGDVDGDAYQILASELGLMREEYVQQSQETVRLLDEGLLTEGELSKRVQALAVNRSEIEAQEQRQHLLMFGRQEEVMYWQQRAAGVSASNEVLERQETVRQRLRGEVELNLSVALESAQERAAYGDITEHITGWFGLDRVVAGTMSPSEAAGLSALFRAPFAHLDGLEDPARAAAARGDQAYRLFSALEAGGGEALWQQWQGADMDARPGLTAQVQALVGGDWSADDIEGLLGLPVQGEAPGAGLSLQQILDGTEAHPDMLREQAMIEGRGATVIPEFQKLMDKMVGSTYSEEQVRGLQASITTAGGQMLGQVYNTITPMMMDAVGEYALARASRLVDVQQAMEERIQVLVETNVIHPSEAETLRAQMTGDNSQWANEAMQRFADTRDFSSGIQQLMRDAIKPKAGTDLAQATLASFEFEGRRATLDDHLRLAGEGSQGDLVRGRVLDSFIASNLGEGLGIGFGDVTSLGALSMLQAFTKADSESLPGVLESMGQRFGKEVLNQESAADLLAASMQRTVAQYRVGRLGDEGVRSLYSYYQRTYGPGDLALSLDEALLADPRMTETRFKERKDKLAASVADLDGQRLVLLDLMAEDVESSGVFTAERVMSLREQAAIRGKLRHDPGSAADRMLTYEDTAQSAMGQMMLSMLQREDQVDPNAMMGGSLGMLGAFQKMLMGAGDALGMNREENIYPIVMGIPMHGRDESDRQLLALLLNDNNVAYQVAEATTAFGAMYGLAGELAYNGQVLAEAGTSGTSDEIREMQLNIARQYATAQTATTLGEITSVLRSVDPRSAAEQDAARGMLEAVGMVARGEVEGAADPRRTLNTGKLSDIFIGPALVALMASNQGLDERVGMFAVDVAQSVAMTDSFQKSALWQEAQMLRASGHGSLVPDWMQNRHDPDFLSRRMRMARSASVIRHAEDPTAGFMQAMIQESMMVTVGAAAQMATRPIGDFLESRKVAGPGVSRAITETFSTLVALSTSRATAAQITQAPLQPPDFVERMLRQFAEQVWMTVEQVQMLLNSAEGMLIDEETGTRIDFEAEAYPGLIGEGLDTGLIIIDPEGNEVPFNVDPFAEAALQTVQSAMEGSAVDF